MPFYYVASIVIGQVTSANQVRSHSAYKALSPAVCSQLGSAVPVKISRSQHVIDTIVIMFRTFGYAIKLLLNSYYRVYICSWIDVRTSTRYLA